MAHYFARLELRPATIVHGRTTIDVDDERVGRPKVVINNIWEEDQKGNRWTAGLRFDVTTQAVSLAEAAVFAREVGEYMATQISLLCSVGLAPLRPVVIVDIDPRSAQHPFMQFLGPAHMPISRRQVYPPHLFEFANSMDTIPQGKRRKHIFQSLRLHRRALQGEELLESFMLLFIAFEALDLPLRKRFGIKKGKLAGMKAFLATRDSGLEILERALDLRNGLAHGKPYDESMEAEAREVSPLLRLKLLEAYGFLLRMSIKEGMRSDPLRLREATEFRVSTVLSQDGEGPLGLDGDPPMFDVILENVQLSTQPKGDTILSGRIHLHKKMAPGVKFLKPKVEVYGPDIGKIDVSSHVSTTPIDDPGHYDDGRP